MSVPAPSAPLPPTVKARAQAIFDSYSQINMRRIDRMFAYLMLIQWLAGIALAYWLSPLAWAGTRHQTHIHVVAAVFLGGIITFFPVILAFTHSGSVWTRQCIAVGQMLMSALLIHLSGGRIETHFHVFGSLAFLAFYRDWRVLVSASLVVAVDHLLRGLYLPQSVYGVLIASPWRWVEHVAWVAFEDVFLIIAIRQGLKETQAMAEHQALAEAGQANIAQLNTRLQRAMTETHHRVKNNLQLIAAMVDISLQDSSETLPASDFQRLGTYVGTLARVHDLLTVEAKQDGQAHFLAIKALLENLLSMMQQTASRYEISARIEDARLTSKAGTSLALVTNELVSNALKHGRKRVEVTLHMDGRTAVLTVGDDGPGFGEGFDPMLSANTGLQLIASLVQSDLNGCAEYSNLEAGGAQVTVTFPMPTGSEEEAFVLQKA